MIRRPITRLRTFIRLWMPRKCDYCCAWFADPDLWVCGDCTEMRTAAWYAADCPPS